MILMFFQYIDDTIQEKNFEMFFIIEFNRIILVILIYVECMKYSYKKRREITKQFDTTNNKFDDIFLIHISFILFK